jgi:hypothetical protein
MATRTTQSSARSSGGVSTAGNALDTVVVIGGDGRKEVLTITWSYGANGAGISVAYLPLFGRLLVIAGVDASGYLAAGNLPTGVLGDVAANGLVNFGGRIVLDVDLTLSNTGGAPQQFSFPTDHANEGWIGTDSGPLTIILTAPQMSNGTTAANIIGKLTVQYANIYASNLQPSDGGSGYTFAKVSAGAI